MNIGDRAGIAVMGLLLICVGAIGIGWVAGVDMMALTEILFRVGIIIGSLALAAFGALAIVVAVLPQ